MILPSLKDTGWAWVGIMVFRSMRYRPNYKSGTKMVIMSIVICCPRLERVRDPWQTLYYIRSAYFCFSRIQRIIIIMLMMTTAISRSVINVKRIHTRLQVVWTTLGYGEKYLVGSNANVEMILYWDRVVDCAMGHCLGIFECCATAKITHLYETR